MSANILIGCPVYDRAWILPTWFEFIEKQNYPKANIGFIFELGDNDDETHDVLWNWQVAHPEYKGFDAQIYMRISHEAHPDGTRVWGAQKYENMVTLRNNLLERVAGLSEQYDYYFSLDSDILLEDPETLNKLVAHAESLAGADVLSPLSYMTPFDTEFPSAMTWVNDPGAQAIRDLNKYPVGEVFEADIVMAAVFMKKHVFEKIRYRWHLQGEDLGFATNLAYNDLHSYAVWDIYCPHIMHRPLLDDYLRTRIDGRKSFKFYI